jgi:death-on-curing protein
MQLTVEKIIAIHSLQILRDGQIQGIRDYGLLETLVAYRLPEARTAFEAAAIVLYTLAVDHPFFDGNKRAAFVTADFVLELAGHAIVATEDEAFLFVKAVAVGQLTHDAIEKWLRENSAPGSGFTESLEG